MAGAAIFWTGLLLLPSLLTAGGPALDAGWQPVSPSPFFQNGLKDIQYGDGKYVAVGGNGALAYSVNGVDWTGVNSGMNETISTVARGDAGWVAISASAVLKSADGIQWTRQVVTGPQGTGDLAFGAGKYVAVKQNQIFSSTDGEAWTLRGDAGEASLRFIVHGDDGFVAAGGDAGSVRSADGITWQAPSDNSLAAAGAAVGMAYGAGVYAVIMEQVTVSSIGSSGGGVIVLPGNPSTVRTRTLWASANGQNWTQINTEGRFLTSVQYSGTLGFLVTAQSSAPGTVLTIGEFATASMFTSMNGLAWTESPSQGYGDPAISLGDGSASRWLLANSEGRCAVSQDGINWTLGPAMVTRGALLSVAYGSGRYVVVNSFGNLYTSPDAKNWTARDTLPISKLAYGNGVFIGVGDKNRIYRSEDGIFWTSSFFGGVSYYTSTQINDVLYANGKFLIHSGGTGLAFSPDGVAWTSTGILGLFDSYYRPMLGAWPGGFAVMAWRGGDIYRNTNGTEWVHEDSSEEYGFNDMIVSGSRWVGVGSTALGGSPKIGLSDNLGATWSVPAAVPPHFELTAIATGGGETVAVGGSGEILSSSDLQTWERTPLFTSHGFSDVIYANGRFLAVGGNGMILAKQKQVVNDGFSWRLSSVEVSEEAGVATLTVDRLGNAGAAVAIGVRSRAISAQAGVDFEEGSWVLNFAAGETSKTVEIPVTNDELAEWNSFVGSGTAIDSPLRRKEIFHVGFAQIPGGYAIFGPEECSVGILDDDGKTLAQWGQENFSEEELQNPLVSGDQADPDLDGRGNLFEYALGFDPRSDNDDGNRLPLVEMVVTPLLGENVKGFSFVMDRSKTAVLYVPQVSFDLTAWNDLAVIDPLQTLISFTVQYSWIEGNLYKVSAWSDEQSRPGLFYRLVIRRR